jgi:hypothetical protein
MVAMTLCIFNVVQEFVPASPCQRSSRLPTPCTRLDRDVDTYLAKCCAPRLSTRCYTTSRWLFEYRRCRPNSTVEKHRTACLGVFAYHTPSSPDAA